MAKCPHAIWYGGVTVPTGPMPPEPWGLVVHITDGNLGKQGQHYVPAIEWLAGTFNNTGFPAHFATDRYGFIGKYLDTDKKDKAQENDGSHWFSVENAVFRGDTLSGDQIDGVAILFAWLADTYPTIPLQVANSPAEKGLGHHSMFLTPAQLKDPKRHSNCPGHLVIAQKQAIVEKAKKLAGNAAAQAKESARLFGSYVGGIFAGTAK